MSSMASQLRPATGTRLESNALGRSVSMQQRKSWKHPWFTLPQWNAKRNTWYALVRAGFVNGFAPIVQTTVGEMRYARAAWFGQLVTARSGAGDIDQLARLAVSGEDSLPDKTPIEVPLYQNPPIGLYAWKAIGWDGEGPVPPYFSDRGVGKPRPSLESQIGGQISADELAPPKGNRLLRSCDIILQQPRAALTSQIQIVGTLVVQMLGQRNPRSGDTLRIVTGHFTTLLEEAARANPYPTANTVANQFEEDTVDRALIARVYLLSPPGAQPGSMPDGTWEPFVQHSLFWNLHWSQPRLEQLPTNMAISTAIASVKFLGGGAGSIAIDYLANSIDMATNAAINLIRGTSLGGTFWTPTGGGTTSAEPLAEQVETIKKTLNKAANRAAKESARRAIQRARRLDPPFPFEGRPFNPALLNS